MWHSAFIHGLVQRLRLLASGKAARLLATDATDADEDFQPREHEPHPFDRAHAVDTSGLLYIDQLATGHEHDQFSEGYYATAPSLFRGAMNRWRSMLLQAAVEDYAFIDLGCGKGRVLMMASEFPFRSVIGIELNPQLARTARTNLAAWLRSPRACRNVRALQGDVLQVPLPGNPLLLFLFNAFDRDLVRALLERLEVASSSRRAPIDLIYIHPDHDDLVRCTQGIEVLLNEQIPFSAEDAAADAFQVKDDQCCIYRLAGRRQEQGRD